MLAREWEKAAYVLALFGVYQSSARRQYQKVRRKRHCYRKARPELSGGGLIRSLGGEDQAKMLRKTGSRVKGDERIVGESGFVEQVLSAANELMNRRYQLRAKGFTCSEIDENRE